MNEQKEEKNIEIVEDHYIQVSESRIRNAVKEYKGAQPFNGVLSSSFACMISFFVAFVSYSSSEDVWKLVFLVLGILSALVFAIFGIITLVRKKIGKGTEKWFLAEIRGQHPIKPARFHTPSNPKMLFNAINFVLVVGIPVSVLLAVLGVNEWSVWNQEWAPMFWAAWIVGSLISLVFGTFINAYFAYLFFGFEDGFPDLF